MPEIQEINGLITKVKKIKKIDKPILKPTEKKKRGRKKKQVMQMTLEQGEFIICFD